MNLKYKVTVKDIVLILLFIGLVIVSINQESKSNDNFSVSAMIEQTMLLMLSYVGLIEISSHIGWTIFVPDFHEFSIRQKHKNEARDYLEEYFKNDINFIRDYDEERIGFLMSQLGITCEQFDRIRLDLIRMRCIPLKNMDDARAKIINLVKGDYPIVINQRKMDSSKVCYNKVDYYINITDIMFFQNYARELSSILAFLITENTIIASVDKLIVPYDSNFLLGVEVGKNLKKSVVKMRQEKGKIETEKPWEGTLSPQDRVIIVHDVLVTGAQIQETRNKLPPTCQVLGLFCLIARKEWNGVAELTEGNIKVHRIIDLDDEDIGRIRGDR